MVLTPPGMLSPESMVGMQSPESMKTVSARGTSQLTEMVLSAAPDSPKSMEMVSALGMQSMKKTVSARGMSRVEEMVLSAAGFSRVNGDVVCFGDAVSRVNEVSVCSGDVSGGGLGCTDEDGVTKLAASAAMNSADVISLGIKTAFTTLYRSFQFRVIPFGLQGAPATFQCMMDIFLADVGEYAAAYLDDVVIHSNTWEDHIRYIREILCTMCRLDCAGLTVKPKKCQFAMAQYTYLGHVVSNGKYDQSSLSCKQSRIFPLPLPRSKFEHF